MDKALARALSDRMLDVTARLNESIALVQQHGTPEELEQYRDVIARMLGDVLLEILNPIYEEHPELKPAAMS